MYFFTTLELLQSKKTFLKDSLDDPVAKGRDKNQMSGHWTSRAGLANAWGEC